MNYDYLYEFNRKRYKTLYERDIECKSNLNVIEIDDGYLLPAKKNSKRLIGLGGVLDYNYNFIKESSIISGGGFIQLNNEDDYEIYFGGKYDIFNDKDNINTLEEEVVYLGYINNHWGHFLIDFCTRLWYIISNKKYKKYVFLVNEGKKHYLINNIKRFFELLEIPLENIMFINKVTKCKKIIIPEPSYITNKYYSQEYINIFNKIASNVNMKLSDNEEKVYFTRCGYSKAKNTEIGEEMLVNLFKKNGFKVISPEKCSLDEQIALIRNSKIIAGISGTITHNMLFADEKQKVIIINKTFSLNTMQMDINIMRNLEMVYIDSYISIFPVSLGHGPFILTYNKEIEKFIKDNNLNIPDKKFFSDKFVKKNIKKYENMYRKLNNNLKEIQYEKKINKNDYYSPEHLIDFYEKYYLISNPISRFEIVEGKVKRISSISGKIIERLKDIYNKKLIYR